MGQAVQLYFRLISIQIRSQMQYRFSFWMDLVSTAMLNGMFFFSLALTLERFKTIAGWTLGEIAFLAGMTETGFALMDLLFGGFDPDTFSQYVQTGGFDQFLLRPVHITVQIFGSRFLLRRLGRFIEGLAILIIGFALTNIQWTLWKVLYLPVALASQVVGMGALFIAGGTLTFWTIQRIEAMNILTYGGQEMMSYPMNIYPGWLRSIFTYLVPLIFLNYYPALFFLDKPDPLNFPPFAPFIAPVMAGLMLLAALRFWKFGVDHYQSTGT
jgi:ABC-2 type transport system permease protein